MDEMFNGATAFTHKLCGDAWIQSTASKGSMFEGSSGSISSTVCTITTATPAFSPQSREELQSAVDVHLEHSAKGGDQMHGSEATSSATGSDQGTFVCKPEVCHDKSCNTIGWYSNDVLHVHWLIRVLHCRLTASESAVAKCGKNHDRSLLRGWPSVTSMWTYDCTSQQEWRLDSAADSDNEDESALLGWPQYQYQTCTSDQNIHTYIHTCMHAYIWRVTK